ncbi:MAG: glutathione S-transferase family protein [Gammaproteobacteria bacterium]|jgi:glutathione S-transferase
MKYALYYWPGIQGRGEFVRLALEEGGAGYTDTALVPESEGGGVPALMELLADTEIAQPPLAPPILKAGRRVIAQTANILLFLGGRLNLAPRDEAGKLWTHQLQLTIADFTDEIHDSHHPIAASLYYEQQRGAAKRRTKLLLDERVPKFMGYFEQVIERNPNRGGWLVGAKLSYADLSIAQVVAGLHYAFPKRMKRAMRDYSRVQSIHDRVFTRRRISAYVRSGRRIPFNEYGLFRHYAELDQ